MPAALVALGILAGGGAFALTSRSPSPLDACRATASAADRAWGPETKAATKAAFLVTGKVYAESTFTSVERRLDAYTGEWATMYTSTCDATYRQGRQTEVLLDLRLLCLNERLAELRALTGRLREANETTLERASEAASELQRVDECGDTRALAAQAPLPADRTIRDRIQAARARLAEVRADELLGYYEEGLEPVAAAVETARSLGYRPLEAEAMHRLGRLHSGLGDYTKAADALNQAIWAAEAGRSDEVAADAWIDLLALRPPAADSGFEDLLSTSRLAEAAVERLGEDRGRRAQLLRSQAAALLAYGKHAEALPYAERALEIVEDVKGSDHPDTARALNTLAAVLLRLDRRGESRECFLRASTIYEAAFGPRHPLVAILLSNYARTLHVRETLDEAIRLHQRALEIGVEAMGADHASVATIEGNLGAALLERGDAREGVPLLEHAVATNARVLGPTNGFTLQVRDLLALSRVLAGQPASGLGEIGEVVAIHEAATPVPKGRLLRSLSIAAEIALAAGSAAEAERFARRALAIAEQIETGDRATNTAGALGLLGRALWMRGNVDEALMRLERAESGSGAELPHARGHVGARRFALARILWARPAQRARALEIARRAEIDLASALPRHDALRAAVSAWLRAPPLRDVGRCQLVQDLEDTRRAKAGLAEAGPRYDGRCVEVSTHRERTKPHVHMSTRGPCSALFLPHAPAAQRLRLAGAADLEETLASCIARAREAWPDIALTPERFLPYIAERMGDGKDPCESLRSLYIEELALCCAAEAREPNALRALAEHYVPSVEAVLRRHRLDQETVRDLRQDLLEKLTVADAGGRPKLSLYAGRGSLTGWLKVVAAREARHLIKKGAREEPSELEVLDRAAVDEGDHEIAFLKARYGKELKESFAAAMATLSVRERNLLRYSLVDGLNIDQIGEIHHVHRATIARWIDGARERILKATRREMMARLEIDRREFESIVRLVQSQLHMSVCRLLEDD